MLLIEYFSTNTIDFSEEAVELYEEDFFEDLKDQGLIESYETNWHDGITVEVKPEMTKEESISVYKNISAGVEAYIKWVDLYQGEILIDFICDEELPFHHSIICPY